MLENYQTNAIVDFIEKLFDGYCISYFLYNNDSSIAIAIQANNVPMKEDSALLLDKCIILNTYMQNYFLPMDYLDLYDIHYWDSAYKEKDAMYHDFSSTQEQLIGILETLYSLVNLLKKILMLKIELKIQLMVLMNTTLYILNYVMT